MNCPHCQGELKRGTADYTDSRSGYVIVLKDIPAWICEQCSEPLFEGDAVEVIQQVLASLDKQVPKLRDVA